MFIQANQAKEFTFKWYNLKQEVYFQGALRVETSTASKRSIRNRIFNIVESCTKSVQNIDTFF